MSQRATTTGRRAISTIAFLAGAATAVPAYADLEVAAYSNPDAFMYLLTGMSDHDQVRQAQANPLRVGLPNNGNMYCVPTCTMNMFTYAANHGFPEMQPGPGYWAAGSEAYNELGTALNALGTLMLTDADGGTGNPGWFSGTNTWLLASGVNHKFTITQYIAEGNYAPQFAHLAKAGIDGGLVSFVYGRYDVTGMSGPFPILTRQSGHCVTLTQAQALAPLYRIWFRDPASESADPFTQSPYASAEWDLELMVAQTSASIQSLKIFWRFDGDFADGRFRIIDKYRVIKPRQGYAFSDSGGSIINPALMGGMAGQLMAPLNPTHGSPLLDLDLHYDLVDLFALHAGENGDPATVHLVDRLAGTGAPLVDVPGAIAMTTGRKRDLFVLFPDRIDQFDFEVDPALIASYPLDCTGDAIAYDDTTDDVVVLCTTTASIKRISPDTFDPAATTALPSVIPLGGGARLAVHPETGDACFVTDAAPNTIYCVHVESDGSVTTTTIDVPGPAPVNDFTVDDLGHVVAITDDGWLELKPDPLGGWSPVGDSLWADAPGAPRLLLSRSRTNYDPAVHDGPGWANIDPSELEFGTEILDCPGDLDRDGTVGFSDLLAALAAWGDCPVQDVCTADLNDDGTVGFEDLLTILSSWGACP